MTCSSWLPLAEFTQWSAEDPHKAAHEILANDPAFKEVFTSFGADLPAEFLHRAVRVAGKTADGVRVSSGLAVGESLAVGDFAQFSDGLAVTVQP